MPTFRSNIEKMSPYIPGEQSAGARQVVKLNTNENPYPPSPAVADALRRFDPARLGRYPDAMASALSGIAADVYGVPADWILPGNGSDDLIVMICRAAAGPGRRIVQPVPTFTYYETQAQVSGAELVSVELTEDFELDIDALVAAEGDVVFIAEPNSPTGVAAGQERLDDLASRTDTLVVIDEAYVDFADGNCLPLAKKHDNVVVLRTLSKGYSLAGLRVGLAIARPEILAQLAKTKQIYNVGHLPQALATAALGDPEHKKANADRIRTTRARLVEQLAAMGMDSPPSQTNFVLARVPDGRAREVYEGLKARGVLVRYYDRPRLDDRLRITVGTDAEIDRLLEDLRELLGKPVETGG